MSWWWLLGGIVAVAALWQSAKATVKAWQLRALSPDQRRAVELRLEGYKLFTDIALAASRNDAGSWERAKRKQREIDGEYTRLFDTFDEEQRNQMFRGLDRVWWTLNW